jgi:hypothetical protein
MLAKPSGRWALATGAGLWGGLEGGNGAGGFWAPLGEVCDGVEALHSSVAARREDAANARRAAKGLALRICVFDRMDLRSILVQDEHTFVAAIVNHDVWAMMMETLQDQWVFLLRNPALICSSIINR